MAGKATVTVELLDGTSITKQYAWTGGNPRFEAWEFLGASSLASKDIRTALASIYGDAKRGEN